MAPWSLVKNVTGSPTCRPWQLDRDAVASVRDLKDTGVPIHVSPMT